VQGSREAVVGELYSSYFNPHFESVCISSALESVAYQHTTYLPASRGVVQNIRFENFYIEGAGIGPAINQDSGDNGSYAGTSLMEVSNIAFVNFTGYTQGGKGNRTASVSCSNVHPCFNIALQNVSLADAANGTAAPAQGSCAYIAPNGVSGLTGSGC
jgi:galacturan 1,4-alpha-galacturonidase